MIEADELTKCYDKMAAIRDVSFTVEKGAIVGFLGPNSAGKTDAADLDRLPAAQQRDGLSNLYPKKKLKISQDHTVCTWHDGGP